MSGPENSKSDERDESSGGGVTTVSSTYSAASPFSDDSPESPYGSAKSAGSAWSGSPYEPLDSESSASSGMSASAYPASYGATDSASPTYVPAPQAEAPEERRSTGRQTKQRAVAGLFSAILGTLLVGAGLYLIGEFGMGIFQAMLNQGGQPSGWDITWTSVGAGLIFVAVLLNGWSPWATLIPGAVLTAAGIWSMARYDGADRVASFIDQMFARPEMVVWGITGWMLVLGLMMLGASFAVVIARAVGRRRPVV